MWRSLPGSPVRWAGVALALAVPVLVRPPALAAEVGASAVFLVAAALVATQVRKGALGPVAGGASGGQRAASESRA
jgi:hypothetical protein